MSIQQNQEDTSLGKYSTYDIISYDSYFGFHRNTFKINKNQEETETKSVPSAVLTIAVIILCYYFLAVLYDAGTFNLRNKVMRMRQCTSLSSVVNVYTGKL